MARTGRSSDVFDAWLQLAMKPTAENDVAEQILDLRARHSPAVSASPSISSPRLSRSIGGISSTAKSPSTTTTQSSPANRSSLYHLYTNNTANSPSQQFFSPSSSSYSPRSPRLSSTVSPTAAISTPAAATVAIPDENNNKTQTANSSSPSDQGASYYPSAASLAQLTRESSRHRVIRMRATESLREAEIAMEGGLQLLQSVGAIGSQLSQRVSLWEDRVIELEMENSKNNKELAILREERERLLNENTELRLITSEMPGKFSTHMSHAKEELEIQHAQQISRIRQELQIHHEQNINELKASLASVQQMEMSKFKQQIERENESIIRKLRDEIMAKERFFSQRLEEERMEQKELLMQKTMLQQNVDDLKNQLAEQLQQSFIQIEEQKLVTEAWGREKEKLEQENGTLRHLLQSLQVELELFSSQNQLLIAKVDSFERDARYKDDLLTQEQHIWAWEKDKIERERERLVLALQKTKHLVLSSKNDDEEREKNKNSNGAAMGGVEPSSNSSSPPLPQTPSSPTKKSPLGIQVAMDGDECRIIDICEGGLAENSQVLRRGDVIVSIQKKPITKPEDIRDALSLCDTSHLEVIIKRGLSELNFYLPTSLSSNEIIL